MHTSVQGWIAENVGGSPPPVHQTGPASIPQYPTARISALVTIDVNSAGDVTGSHDALGGTYTISADGAVVDSLSL